MTIHNALQNYVMEPENPDHNFRLALHYDDMGHTASAITFYLRAADRTEDLNLAYACLIKMSDCFDRQGNRHYTVRGLLRHAISILPKRPEAYYNLARFDEYYKQYMESYSMASAALDVCDFDLPPLQGNVRYLGKPGIMFEKAVSAWWWGKSSVSRAIFHELVDDYWDEMPEWLQGAVENNLTKLGSGPESQAFTYYFQNEHEKLRYQFPGSENIERSYSQVYQDMFILSMLDGKRDGTFLEIGGAGPFLGNNTMILEKDFGWKGHSIEYDQKFIPEYQMARPGTPIHCIDALKVNWNKFIKDHYGDVDTIDYLQLDIEPARNTFELLLNIPFDDYKFAVITYEHDYYVDVTKSYRKKSRRYLQMMGYEMIVNDVSPDGQSNFEDWWVHPDLVSRETIEKMKSIKDHTQKAKDYIFNVQN